MSDSLAIAEYRVRKYADKLLDAVVSSADLLVVGAAAADFLDAFYMLSRYWRDELGTETYDAACHNSEAGEVAGGLTFLRGAGVHRAVVTSDLADTYSDIYSDVYGTWVWARQAPGKLKELRPMYEARVSGREVYTTVEPACDFLLVDLPTLANDEHIPRG